MHTETINQAKNRILDLWSLGLQMIPVNERKYPPFSWKQYQTRRISEEQLRGWLNHYGTERWGMVTGELCGIVGLDADSSESADWLTATLPRTLVQTETARARHDLYRHPGGGIYVSSKRVRDDLDRKGDGGILVAPGTRHQSGWVYKEVVPWTAELLAGAPVYDPAWFPEAAGGNNGWDFDAEGILQRSDLPPLGWRIAQARKHLDTCPGAEAGRGADGYCLALAGCLLWDYALPAETAAELLWEWGQRADQLDRRGGYYPWRQAEIAHKVKDALDAGPKDGKAGRRLDKWHLEAGEEVAQKIQELQPVTTPPKPSKRYKVMTMEDIFNMREPEWLVDKHITEGAHVTLFGPSGSYKSFMAIDLALSIANGVAFLNAFPTKRRRVAYIISEGRTGLKRRLMAWNAARKMKLSTNVAFLPAAFDLGGEVGRTMAMDLLTDHFGQQPEVIVIDTLSRNFGGKNTSDPTEMQNWCDSVQRWGITTIAVHHTGWNEERERGASNIRDCSDTSIRVRKDGARATLTCIKQKDNEEFEEYTVEGSPHGQGDLASLAFTYKAGAPSHLQRFASLFPTDPAKARIFDDVYTSNPVWFDATGWNLATARNNLTNAKKANLLLSHPDDIAKPKGQAKRYYRSALTEDDE